MHARVLSTAVYAVMLGYVLVPQNVTFADPEAHYPSDELNWFIPVLIIQLTHL